MTRALALIAFALALSAEDDPFADGKVEIRHDGDKRVLVFEGRNVSGKDIKTMVIAYALRDGAGKVVQSEMLLCQRKTGEPVVPKDFAGPVWVMPIAEDAVVTASFGCQEVDFADGTRWLAPTRRRP
jgi:hypothetical protein